jgi:hypothetical protein
MPLPHSKPVSGHTYSAQCEQGVPGSAQGGDGGQAAAWVTKEAIMWWTFGPLGVEGPPCDSENRVLMELGPMP